VGKLLFFVYNFFLSSLILAETWLKMSRNTRPHYLFITHTHTHTHTLQSAHHNTAQHHWDAFPGTISLLCSTLPQSSSWIFPSQVNWQEFQ